MAWRRERRRGGLFIASWFLRRDSPGTPMTPTIFLSAIAVVIGTGWLGGELVDRLGVGVDEGGEPQSAELAERPRGDRTPPRA